MRLASLMLFSAALLLAQGVPMEPARDAGNSLTGSFEGWFKNADGTFSLLIGYYNRNQKQEVDIPIGPENKIEPGGPDQGQPTHFVPGRGWGVFTIQVPANFGQNKLNWTLTANGKTTVIPLNLKSEWEISPFVEFSVGNTPPALSFEEKGPSVQGPRLLQVQRTAKIGDALPLTLWVADDAKYTSNSGARPKVMPPAVTLRWTLYRGPAQVSFREERPAVVSSTGTAAFNGKASTTVGFSEPGEYILQVMANDYSGEGGSGFQCCWSTARVKVNVAR